MRMASFLKKMFDITYCCRKENVQLAQTARHVSYIGNLKCGRYKTLIDIGKALSELRDENVPNVIDVYSGTREFDCIEPLKKHQELIFVEKFRQKVYWKLWLTVWLLFIQNLLSRK